MINITPAPHISQNDCVVVRLHFGIRMIPLGMAIIFAFAGIGNGYDSNHALMNTAFVFGLVGAFITSRRLAYVYIKNGMASFRSPLSKTISIPMSKIVKIHIGTNELQFDDGISLTRKVYVEFEPDAIFINDFKMNSLISDINYFDEKKAVKSFTYNTYFSTVEIKRSNPKG